ncbi:uncharacterized protein DUF4253 [Krasilnikovia cinnamomea]|uniref:Uncharacterized protein DUF4253 n=1 Tax=Krasilnikovia cinnamomea TaxID=349313 RepID=A0A4Q7ZPY6_9ACTN|nr:DUF4253 domain-containing protein [Krasilnikovia cinnamomea]RZU53150.1 uncharacterized protein DUF4253 [Krasilnikovia cinnamomea]
MLFGKRRDRPHESPLQLPDIALDGGWWAFARARHERTGLWPLLLHGLSEREPDRPWLTGELHPGRSGGTPSDHDPEALLARWWAAGEPEPEEDEEGLLDIVAPFLNGWPGRADAGVPRADPDELGGAEFRSLLAADWIHGSRPGLVPAGRGADVPTVLGWAGPTNHDSDISRVSAVLRDWEDRFGTRLIGLGFDTMYLSVAAPPVERDHALRVAAEHFALAPDNITQGTGSLAEYAGDLMESTRWSFWWD